MKIVKYKKLKTNKYELTLDNSDRLVLYEDVILKEELLLKKEITDIKKILRINNQYEVYDVALKYLNHHVMSIYGMQEYLLKKNYTNNDIQYTINKLINKGYLNDEYYTKCYVNNQINLSNDGPLRIKKHLEYQHISSDVYDKYLEVNNSLWQNRIEKYIDKQKKRNKKSLYFFKNKMLINLTNLGYDKEMINGLLERITIENSNELKELTKSKIQKKLARKYEGEELEKKVKEKLWQKGFFE